MFVKVTGVDSKNNAVESSNPKDFGVTWSEVAAKERVRCRRTYEKTA